MEEERPSKRRVALRNLATRYQSLHEDCMYTFQRGKKSPSERASHLEGGEAAMVRSWPYNRQAYRTRFFSIIDSFVMVPLVPHTPNAYKVISCSVPSGISTVMWRGFEPPMSYRYVGNTISEHNKQPRTFTCLSQWQLHKDTHKDTHTHTLPSRSSFQKAVDTNLHIFVQPNVLASVILQIKNSFRRRKQLSIPYAYSKMLNNVHLADRKHFHSIVLVSCNIERFEKEFFNVCDSVSHGVLRKDCRWSQVDSCTGKHN